jgi:hypothetical protein
MVPQDFSFVDHMLALVREGSFPDVARSTRPFDTCLN